MLTDSMTLIASHPMKILSHLSIRPSIPLYRMNVHTILPRSPYRTCQCSRAFHLLHTLFTATIDEASARKLTTVSKKSYPCPDELSLKLIHGESDEVTTVTLSEALRLLQPLSYLTKVRAGAYRIQQLRHPGPIEPLLAINNTSYKPWTRAGRGKEIHLTTSCTPQNLHHLLSKSYAILQEGSRLEFHLHQKTADRQYRTVDWALAHCMHLRPDSILAAMPEGTTMLAEPATTDLSFKPRAPKRPEVTTAQVMWAIENTKALSRARASTSKSIKQIATWSGKNDAVIEHSSKQEWSVTTPTSI